ncbi:aldehyde dehydrogenase (NAD+) [Paraburkholderia sp. WC7.3g]|uniref:Aldehyde dehydrogenase n=1 Tax=Paraburkholderia podalyriae TaxID=1938811 RepID=A0ABR7PI05_9BURK|nr:MULTISPECIES: aldehyde dehydrogenase family protein [Paraburkholderia]MBB5406367.1 aldehyde dehydrogenase (NAD+) [Paraburkholderia sp. HC6.4b]MBB5448765.1 aldehyde dehydrogenase (NAD+) [Paraburkholderia sp. Kb1A]MBC8745972.1 aldehyde dehydrogenase [Paraburkholderia podalyriae]
MLSILGRRNDMTLPPLMNYVDGRWTNEGVSERYVQRHPATNEVTAELPETDAETVGVAVQAARRAFDQGPWSRMKARDRKQLFRRIVDVIERHADELSWLQTLDNGMPIAYSLNGRVSARNAVDIFDHYGGWIDKINGETYPDFHSNMQFMSFREPVGVVGAIIPWNAPIMMFAMKVAPALAAGCTVVLKPSELAGLCALRMTQLIEEVDLPPGVLNVVMGGGGTGRAIVEDTRVDKIAFTGSNAVGAYILSRSGQNMKRTTMELGGKSAAIVFPDCDVEAAGTHVMGLSSTFLSGQVCSTTSRALVHRSVYDRFLDAAARQVKTIRRGDPFSMDTTSAALISEKQTRRVLEYVDSGRADGARLVFGGTRSGGELSAGNWVEPALFADVNNRTRIAQEEIFGPVLSAIPFDTEEDAIALANDSGFGLAGTVYTKDISRAFKVARAVRTGIMGINGYGVVPSSPVGGFKGSGLGREGGWPGIEAYTEIKTVMINLDA